MRGRIKFDESDEEWIWGEYTGELIFFTSERNGTIWRITPHPSKVLRAFFAKIYFQPSFFQIHFDDNCHYEKNIWARKAMKIEFSEKEEYDDGYTFDGNDVIKGFKKLSFLFIFLSDAHRHSGFDRHGREKISLDVLKIK